MFPNGVERRNSIANVLDLRISSTNLSIPLSLESFPVLFAKHIEGWKNESFWRRHFQLHNSAWVQVISFVKIMSFEIITIKPITPLGKRYFIKSDLISKHGIARHFPTYRIFNQAHVRLHTTGNQLNDATTRKRFHTWTKIIIWFLIIWCSIITHSSNIAFQGQIFVESNKL